MFELPDLVSVILRGIGFVLMLQAGGAAIFLAAHGSRLTETRDRVSRLGFIAALSAVVVVACQSLLDAARMAGDFSGVFDPSMQKVAMMSSSGAAAVCRVAGLVLVALAMWRWERTRAGGGRPSTGDGTGVVGLFGSALVALSFAVTGHTSISPVRLMLGPALVIHVAIGMFWFGSLLPLRLVIARESREGGAALVEAFSKVAVAVVPVILIAGIAMTAWLVPGWAVFTQPYGQLLILKLVLFGGLMGLAAVNKWKFGPAMRRGSETAAAACRRTILVEFVLICVVLVVTACLTEFFSPE